MREIIYEAEEKGGYLLVIIVCLAYLVGLFINRLIRETKSLLGE